MASKDLATTSAEDKVMVASTELKAGALHLPEVLMQSVTTIAPAIAALFFTPFLVSFAGVTSPLAYPIAFVITLMLGIVLVQFTKGTTGELGHQLALVCSSIYDSVCDRRCPSPVPRHHNLR